jgi:inner membrane protein
MAVAVLAGLMTIPVGYIYDLTHERYSRYTEVVGEISSSWGTPQTVAGPVLSVPYTVRYQVSETVPLSPAELAAELAISGDRTTKEVLRTVESEHTAMVLPEELFIDGGVSTELRSRSIYSARVYTADLSVSGYFAKPDLSGLRPYVSDIHWDRAMLAVGVTGTKAIRGVVEIDINGESLKSLPGAGGLGALRTGFSCQADLSSLRVGEEIRFSFQLPLGGSERLFFAPLGVSSTFRLKSEWPHPNFMGSGLPAFREITPNGFSAEWVIPNLVRNYPQFGDADEWQEGKSRTDPWRESDAIRVGHDIEEYLVGVEFFEPIFHYSLLIRAAKYAVLFIALTFLGVVILENISKGTASASRLNISQYVVIGLGLSMFYLTLLALSEHLGFTPAYFLAAVINVVMNGGYVLAALRRRQPALLLAVVQALLYAMLFFILRLEDYSLLAGTALLLIAVIALMIVTRNMNRPA